MNPAIRVAIAAIFAAASATLLFPLYLSLRAGGNKVFEPHPFDFALVAVATFAIAVGAQLVPWSRAGYIAFLALLGSAALLFGVLGAFGIGLAVLPVGIVAIVLLYRALHRRPLSAGRPAAIGGALAGYGAILLYIALIVPATVECRVNGGGTSSGRWGGAGVQHITGSASVTPDGVVTGRIESSTSVATYRCEQGRVVEFRRESR